MSRVLWPDLQLPPINLWNALNMNDRLTPDEIRTLLPQFFGTRSYHRWSPLFRNVLLTDGAKFLADTAGAFWLMDMTASHLPSVPETEYFVVAKLTLDVTGGADFRLEDGNDKLYATQRIEYTDFPLPEGITLYAQTDGKQWIIMLTSEY